jgi:hypothetical protein
MILLQHDPHDWEILETHAKVVDLWTENRNTSFLNAEQIWNEYTAVCENLKCWKSIAVKICSFLLHLLWKISSVIHTPTSQWHNWYVYFFSTLRSGGQLQLTYTHTNTLTVVEDFAFSDKDGRNSKWRRVLKLTHLSLYIDTISIRGSVDPEASLRLVSQEKASGPSKYWVLDIQPTVIFLNCSP